MARWLISTILAAVAACLPSTIDHVEPGPARPGAARPASHRAPPAPASEPTACSEVEGLAWPRAAAGVDGWVELDGGAMHQRLSDGSRVELGFAGAHVFDLLNKLHAEADGDAERRTIVCHVLNDAAARGVPVLRLWGTLKRVGSAREIQRSAHLLSLVLEENARRRRPLRFVVTLLNHQAGYGAPDPTRSLDDQRNPAWQARAIYTEGAWRAEGVGSLGERIDVFARQPALTSPYVLAWELVNELDTYRSVAGGRFDGEGGAKLRDGFLVPAAEQLAGSLPQPVMLGDIRGDRDAYAPWADALIRSLPLWVRKRLVWTSHVYVEQGSAPDGFMRKLDVDLALARKHRLPFVLGELGESVPGATPSFCGAGVQHDFGPILAAVRRRGVTRLFVWGEGRCDLDVGDRLMVIGAGADSAEISQADRATQSLLGAHRAGWH